jgi:hypothetical protein
MALKSSLSAPPNVPIHSSSRFQASAESTETLLVVETGFFFELELYWVCEDNVQGSQNPKIKMQRVKFHSGRAKKISKQSQDSISFHAIKVRPPSFFDQSIRPEP